MFLIINIKRVCKRFCASVCLSRRHSVFELSLSASVRPCVIMYKKLLAHLTNRSWEFHQTYN